LELTDQSVIIGKWIAPGVAAKLKPDV